MKTITPPKNNTTLYIGEFDKTVTSEKLKKMFSKYGTVQAITLSQPPQISPFSFGFIRMSSTDEARKCVEKLNNFIINGNPLMVRF